MEMENYELNCQLKLIRPEDGEQGVGASHRRHGRVGASEVGGE